MDSVPKTLAERRKHKREEIDIITPPNFFISSIVMINEYERGARMAKKKKKRLRKKARRLIYKLLSSVLVYVVVELIIRALFVS